MDPWKKRSSSSRDDRRERPLTSISTPPVMGVKRPAQPEWLRDAMRARIEEERVNKEARERRLEEERILNEELGRSRQDDDIAPASERQSPNEHEIELADDQVHYPTPPQSPRDEELRSPSPVKRKPTYISTVASVGRLGCRSVDEFERVRTISEGAYGVVHEAIDRATGEVVALKKIKIDSQAAGFPVTSLREINILMSLRHVNLIELREIVLGRRQQQVFMVMEHITHEVKSLIKAKKEPFSQSEVKCLMQQLLRGVAYLHSHWIIHRDLKTTNLLLDNNGILKICDLGLARRFGSPIKPYSPLVVTLWYRSPELLLGSPVYGTAVDMWSVGCIFAEFLTKTALFEGAQGELDQLHKIFSLLGTPTEEKWPGYSKLPHAQNWTWKPSKSVLADLFPRRSVTSASYLTEVGFDLLNRLLSLDPSKRISAKDALEHAWFREAPKPQDPALISTSIAASSVF